ncbi:EF-hand domain-containing protein [Zavarzinia sp. CC-PAN008]|uniref:EF-hand domain-containing protein n=1 Tax=Zavarzinia sp. CC-PAN008 TaxID=3243332 RepID=UPI003F74A7C0
MRSISLRLPWLLLAVLAPGIAQAQQAASVPIPVRLLFAVIDQDADGVVTADEAAAFSARLIQTVDSNRDGVVTRAEAEAMRQRLGSPGGPRDLDKAFREIDSNGDGVVTEAELAAAARRNFARMDLRGRGGITLADLAGRSIWVPNLGALAGPLTGP